MSTLSPGTRLGPYEIAAPLGAGGMGEVYKARDTRLDRTVAIKVLPAQVASDPTFRQRFEREAKTISSLDHPNICALYDIGCEHDINFLVMQYLEGETLAERLAKGPLPVVQALQHAMEIADALDKAHRQGIVHRDLKPGNVMLTKSGAKLLDFGLAKPAGVIARVEREATITAAAPATAAGTILGTLQYMAPEQLEGKDADARSDIWAFGCVLHEMVTGRRAFGGESQASIVAGILEREPPALATLQPLVPRALDHIVTRCLNKDPENRWQSARDVRLELESVSEERHVGSGQTVVVNRTRERMLVAALAAMSIVAAVLGARLLLNRQNDSMARRFDVTLPPGVHFEDWSDSPVISPDGRYVAFTVTRAGNRQLMVRRLDSRELTPLAGTDGISGNPFWSPDSGSIAFCAARELKRVAVTGGPVVSICACEPVFGGVGAWHESGGLLCANRSGLQRVREEGAAPQVVTRLAPGEFAHLTPTFLPDGRHFLYSAQGARPGIYAGSLDGGEAKRILDEALMAQYVPNGYLLFTRGEALFAQPFDPHTLQLKGSRVMLAEDVFWGSFSASNDGALAYRPSATRTSRLAWFGRDGRRLSVVSDAGRYVLITLSPSGRQVAVQTREEGNNHDLWLLDQATKVLSRLTNDPAFDGDPVWSPDERRIVFSSNRAGKFTLIEKDLITGKEARLLADQPALDAAADDWSSDGRFVVFRHGFGRAIYVLPMEGDRRAQLIAETPWGADQSHVSPDGRWIALHSNESGRWEVYVAAFPAFTQKRQVSTSGGMEPIWRSDTRELFYLDLDGRLMAVPVTTEPSFDVGTPNPLFQTGIRPDHLNQYAAARDGQKFLLLEPDRSGPEMLTFLVDWPARLSSSK